MLVQMFKENTCPSAKVRNELASTIGVKRKSIDDWFRYRRNKYKSITQFPTETSE